jgi:hypothetical protein
MFSFCINRDLVGMDKVEPVHLEEDATTGDRFLIYGSEEGARVELLYQGEQLWMTQAQIAALFGRDVSVISRHINGILEDGELDQNHLHKMQMNPRGGPSTLFSLDMVISVGYRVSSKQATLFRRWATDTLVQFATKGFVVDAVRLKNPDNRDRVAELRDIIRDIRSDEANVYRELRRICAMCQDYVSGSSEWETFYRNTQAKLIFAVTSSTPAALIRGRADSGQPNMGLQTWPHENIRKADVTVSKNYLSESEIQELNRLTTILLDIFEDQLELGRLKTMAEVAARLDHDLANLGRSVLRSGGGVSTKDGKAHAEREYAKFAAAQRELRHAQSDAVIAEIKSTQKALPKGRK